MSLSVIGAGFGRTGTKSLKLALEQLGFGPCHHMEEVLNSPAQLRHWQDAAAGAPVDWAAVFDGFGSTVDWPSAHYWRELAAFYPAAKVVLTVRPARRWWDSFSGTIKQMMAAPDKIPDPHMRAVVEMGARIVAEQTFGGKPDDREHAIAAFEQRIEDVRDALPAERLLVFEVSEGWAPLCEFLGVDVPDGPFPHVNSTQEFLERAKARP